VETDITGAAVAAERAAGMVTARPSTLGSAAAGTTAGITAREGRLRPTLQLVSPSKKGRIDFRVLS
jgi:hypothetical protein